MHPPHHPLGRLSSPTNDHEPPIDSTISVKLFRPDENAKRIRASAERILMEPPPAELFIEACKMAVKVSRFYRRSSSCGLSYRFEKYCFGCRSVECRSARAYRRRFGSADVAATTVREEVGHGVVDPGVAR